MTRRNEALQGIIREFVEGEKADKAKKKGKGKERVGGGGGGKKK